MEIKDFSHCGVGFITSLNRTVGHSILDLSLKALVKLEHRGGVGPEKNSGDGAGIMTRIPFELLGEKEGETAVGSIFLPKDSAKRESCLELLKYTFFSFGLEVFKVRTLEVDESVLSDGAQNSCPAMAQVFVKRPKHCRTFSSFDKLLYTAKQMTKVLAFENGWGNDLVFNSLSSRTIVYKVLGRSDQLKPFYKDLQDPKFKTDFAIFHRRFSTNSLSSWDKVQPFSLMAHNGEINTFAGNRSWAITREKAIGLREGELITHHGVSDSYNLNEVLEALKFRSSIPTDGESLAILIPPANRKNCSYYNFWARAMEPWDGPALINFSDGKMIGARLDRNGFRPCRWERSKDLFYLGSEVGVLDIPENQILEVGSLKAGEGVSVNVMNGKIFFEDPAEISYNKDGHFDAKTISLEEEKVDEKFNVEEDKKNFSYTTEDISQIQLMIKTEKEPIGSMGSTSRPALMSGLNRSLFDYFYQDFAQVTNPPFDYIREKSAVDLSCILGRKPNIFEPKELIPLRTAILLKGPVLSLGQMKKLFTFTDTNSSIKTDIIDITFDESDSYEDFDKKISEIENTAINFVRRGATVLVLSDKNKSKSKMALPSLIALKAVNNALNSKGIRLRTSIVVETGEVRNSHQLATLVGNGASAVCPYVMLQISRELEVKGQEGLFPKQREKVVIKVLEDGILRIMAKMGISVIRSYQGSNPFTIMGFSKSFHNRFFRSSNSILGGLTLEALFEKIKKDHRSLKDLAKTSNQFLLREHSKLKMGEIHSMTTIRSKLVHDFLSYGRNHEKGKEIYRKYADIDFESPSNIRHLFDLRKTQVIKEDGIDESNILKRFGTGAMSYGAISAESQVDIIKAMDMIGGRSNSGEGGENPIYLKEGRTSTIKQMASGRFGVTAEYLIAGAEVQLKMAQGAKPGEGGQLPGEKVDKYIAKARFTIEGKTLISPPPMHDIYSIEDLKELIYEIKQLDPTKRVSVKLVSSKHVGTVAIGVAKAGADIIHISGGDGGTGAAAVTSMRHTGLPWEIGLYETHQVLSEIGLRSFVKLRVDGGILTGRDVLIASILGADEFDFGKMALIALGCVMARVCHKNTCPAGIATQDPKYKGRYTGNAEKLAEYFRFVAEDVKRELSFIGLKSLDESCGRTSFLKYSEKFKDFISNNNIDLSFFDLNSKSEEPLFDFKENEPKNDVISSEHLMNELNKNVLSKFNPKKSMSGSFEIKSTDRAIPASLIGEISKQSYFARKELKEYKFEQNIDLNFVGHAGQGLGVFLDHDIELTLDGVANDFVGKSMHSGKITVAPNNPTPQRSCDRVVVGNCCLYGATGGKLFVHGGAGDRFAVRNSGAFAIVENVGHHACEYMTGGEVLILGDVLSNLGAGMTGGQVFIHKNNISKINKDYVKEAPLLQKDKKKLEELLDEYFSQRKNSSGVNVKEIVNSLVKVVS